MLTKTKEYIASCGNSYEVHVRPNVKDGVHQGDEEYTREIVKVPSIEGLAFHLEINKDTIQVWRKEKGKEEFSVLISRLLEKQAEMLINNGLSGKYNPTIAKVLLTKHGYREGIDATTNDKDLITLKLEERAPILKAFGEI